MPKSTTRKVITSDIEIDSPEQDALGWSEPAKRLALLLALPGRPTPLTIGIQGDWGSGKTSFLNLVLHYLGNKQTPELSHSKPEETPLAKHLHVYKRSFVNEKGFENIEPSETTVHLIKFDSWIFTQSEVSADYLFPLFVTQVLLDYLVAEGKIKDDKDERNWIQWMGQVLPKVGGGVASVGGTAAGFLNPFAGVAVSALTHAAGHALSGSGGMADTTPQRLNTELINFKERFRTLIDTLLLPAEKKGKRTYHNRLIIVVDDLDRVPPLTAVNITEKIKLFMDVPGCIFVLAADLKIIRAGLRAKLGKDVGEEEGKNYLDKIVKIQYQVPQIPRNKVATLAQAYPKFRRTFTKDENRKVALDLLKIFPDIAGTPRNLKRVLNNFAFTLDLQDGPEAKSDPDNAMRVLALTVLHQHDADAARHFYRILARVDTMLKPSEFIEQWSSFQTNQKQELDVFIKWILNCEYKVGEWRSVFTQSTLSPVNNTP